MKSLVVAFFSVSFPLYAAEFMVKSAEELDSLKLSPGDKVLESEKNVTKRVFTDEDVHLLVGASFIDAEGNLIETK